MRIDANAVLRVQGKDGGSGGVFKRVALRKVVLQAKHEIGQGIAAECAVKVEYAVAVPVVVDVHLVADQIDAESHLVLAANHIDIVGKLKGVDIEVSRSAGAASDVEIIADGYLEEVGDRAGNVHADISRINHVGRWSPIIAPARGSSVKGINGGAAEHVCVAECECLCALQISRRRGCQQVLSIIDRGIPVIGNEIAPVQTVLRVLYPVDASNHLLFIAGGGNAVG